MCVWAMRAGGLDINGTQAVMRDGARSHSIPHIQHSMCVWMMRAGGLDINGTQAVMRDGARISGKAAEPSLLRLQAGGQGAHVLMVEMALAE